MLEAVFTLLPLFAIITGFFDVSFALFSWNTLQNAVRMGCRYAVTFQTSGALGQDASIAQIVVQNSMGLLSSTTAIDSSTAGQLSITTNYFTQESPNTAIAAPNGNVPGNIVQVTVVNYPLQWMIPISGTLANPYRSQSPATINLYAMDVLGGYPVGTSSVTR
jgi:Flp pilus assembly protein TadG